MAGTPPPLNSGSILLSYFQSLFQLLQVLGIDITGHIPALMLHSIVNSIYQLLSIRLNGDWSSISRPRKMALLLASSPISLRQTHQIDSRLPNAN